MGKYTALDDPLVDRIVENHLQQIVLAVRSRVEPRSIALRGSFSRGEGSVVVEDNHLRFLSDYELIAITPHYRHRKWLRIVAREMSNQLEVETSISRVHPYNIERNSLGNIPIGGIARPTIAMYEVQNGGQTLFGEHLLNLGPPIDPASLGQWTGLRLIFNRMAESMAQGSPMEEGWEGLRWVTKTVLSCAEAMLITHGKYHFSYAERGRRFGELMNELGPLPDPARRLADLVERATAFKLRPSLDHYPEPVPELWQAVRQGCDWSLHHVINRYLGFEFDAYAAFPELFLIGVKAQQAAGRRAVMRLPTPPASNLFLCIKLIRARRRPPWRLLVNVKYPAHQVAYALIPVVFLGNTADADTVRYWLSEVSPLLPPDPDPQTEWEYLQRSTVRAWKDYCYGLWDAL